MNIKLYILKYADKLNLKKLKIWLIEKQQSDFLNGLDENDALFQLYQCIVKPLRIPNPTVQEKISRIKPFFQTKYKTVYLLVNNKINENKILSHYLKITREKINSYAWVKQLREATTREVIKITLISSFFINILALAFPLTIMQVYDRVIPNQSYSTLITLIIGVILAIILETILRIARSYINLWADTKYEYKLSTKALNNLLHVPLYIYENTDIGTRIKQFAVLDQIRGFYNNQLLVSIADVPFLFVFLLVILYIGGWLVLVPIILGGALLIYSFYCIEKWRFTLQKKLTHESRENDFLVNVLGNIHTAKSLGIENLLIRRYERMQNTNINVTYDSTVQSGDLETIRSMASQASMVFMASFGALSVMQGHIAVGSLIACILLSGRLMIPLVRCVSAFARWKMINMIRTQLDVVLTMPIENNTEMLEIEGDIKLRNIGYLSDTEEKNHWAFKNVNLDIPPRTVISIVGDSQADKEKLLNVLAAIACPTTGEYLLDGKNVDQFRNYQLRTKISYLSKSGSLFYGSIMDNLSAFQESLIPIAKRFANRLGLDESISKLPSGFDTMVGDKAVEALPGSVINSIIVIRALVMKPKIILFDEADMYLDVSATLKMTQLLEILKEIASIIVLPKSKDTIQFSDAVYELHNAELKRVVVNENK